jgi:hypothetical protein
LKETILKVILPERFMEKELSNKLYQNLTLLLAARHETRFFTCIILFYYIVPNHSIPLPLQALISPRNLLRLLRAWG